MYIHPIITSSLFGGFLKLIDDVYDNPAIGMYFSPVAIEFMKSFIFILLSHISMYDFNLLFVLFVSHLVIPMFDKDCLNNSYFMAGMFLLAILCIASFPANVDYGVIVGIFTILILFCLYDTKYAKEESSPKKILFRSITVLGLFALLAIRIFFISSNKLDNVIVASIGYHGISVINMTITEMKKRYNLTKSESESESNPKPENSESESESKSKPEILLSEMSETKNSESKNVESKNQNSKDSKSED